MRKILWILFISFIIILTGCKKVPDVIDDKDEKIDIVVMDPDTKKCDYCGDEFVRYYKRATSGRIYHFNCIKISGLEKRIKELEAIIIKLQMDDAKIPEIIPKKSNEPDLNGYYN